MREKGIEGRQGGVETENKTKSTERCENINFLYINENTKFQTISELFLFS